MSVRIAILVEGRTEQFFKDHLRGYLKPLLAGNMPKLDFAPYQGRLPTKNKLRKDVSNLLHDPRTPADAVIALTDLYTGSSPPTFATPQDAKDMMRRWVGNEPRFYPHVAAFEAEAWLLPYWGRIQQVTGTNRKPPAGEPEKVNHGNPPSTHVSEAFRTGPKSRGYVKARAFDQVLQGQDLDLAVRSCPELRAFVNTILRLCGAPEVAPSP